MRKLDPVLTVVNASASHTLTITKPDGSVITRVAGSPATGVPFSFNPNQPAYAIEGNKQYHLNFPTAKGVHRYHIDVDYFPNGSTEPVLLGTKEFATK